jgi:hypothetical protein
VPTNINSNNPFKVEQTGLGEFILQANPDIVAYQDEFGDGQQQFT